MLYIRFDVENTGFSCKEETIIRSPRSLRPSFLCFAMAAAREEPKEFISTTVEGFLNSGFEAREKICGHKSSTSHHHKYMVIYGY